MKHVLILSCSTGQGHNSCAQAIAEYFTSQGVPCDIRDGLDFISPQTARFISWGHSWIYRYLPGLFRWGYGFSESRPGLFDEKAPAYRFLTAGSEKLRTYIEEQDFDTVICTHVFTALILTHILKEHPMDIRTAFVATDYTCSPSMEASSLQHYFIPDISLLPDYVRSGIPAQRIIATGIPVRAQFEKRTEKADAKRLLDIGPGSRHLLIMCGSMGCGPMVKIVRRVNKIMTQDMEVSVICGTNKTLKKRLTRMCRKNSRIHIVGYTNQMSLYLDSADLYLTKPGGISTTEAAKKGLPMVFINAVDGCESYNRKFFLDRGCAVTAEPPKKLADESIRILNSWEVRGRMEKALRTRILTQGAEAIFRELKGGTAHEQRKYG